ncbi:MAG: anthranilate phosphoribosyltransferase [Syntrophorhabdaceae bacterium]|nr:anthranilate phosphoribosyltransferase [Syntrophorhabdaceae bacterium]
MIREAIDKAVNMVDLKEEEMACVMEEIMEGKATSAQIASFITALRIKGETIDELVGAAMIMRKKALKIRHNGDVVTVDIVGTGGDGLMTFNISTAAAFVVAGGGIRVAKHGNRSISSRCGSADVLEKIGIDVEAPPDRAERLLNEVGIAFLFAPTYHVSTRYAVGPRREIGIRTIFNMLGPLTNPASADHLLIGVYKEELCEMFAHALLRLGAKRAMVVHGFDGMDEITVTSETKVAEIKEGQIINYTIDPRDYGIPLYDSQGLIGGNSDENAFFLREVLSGRERGAKRAAVLINAGAAFYVSGHCRDLTEGIVRAERVIDSGSAMAKLEELVNAGKSM